MKKTFKGRPVVKGNVTATALVSHGGFLPPTSTH